MEDIELLDNYEPERLNTSRLKQIAEIQEKRDRMTKGSAAGDNSKLYPL
jgi:hypothetical protein